GRLRSPARGRTVVRGRAAGVHRHRRGDPHHPAHGPHHTVPRRGRLLAGGQLDHRRAPGAPLRRGAPAAARRRRRGERHMNKELRRVSVLILAMFLALCTSATLIQVVFQEDLQADARNTRTLYASFSVERGRILAGDTVIAQSRPSDDEYRFQREYPAGELYAPVTGYFTLHGENTGLEGALNPYLSGRANEQFLDRLNQILTGQTPRGATVLTTIDPGVQQAAWDALGDLTGAIVAIEPATGRILAMVSKPTFDPNPLAGHNQARVIEYYDALLADAGEPLINRAITGDLNPPGSTFKILMTSAALANGLTPETELGNEPAFVLPGTSTTITNSGGSLCGGGETVT